MKTCIFLSCNMGHLNFANFIAWQLQIESQEGLEIVICSDDLDVGNHVLDGVRFLHLPDVQFFKTLNTIDRLSYYSYLRLPAIELLSREYDRVLYMDTDVFVARKGIREIFDLDLQGAVIGAVRDTQQRINLKRKVADFQVLDYAPAPYFNAGVLLIDCATWQRENCYARLLEIARENPDSLLLHDQSLLNLVFHNNWTELSPVWNWMSISKVILWGEFFGARVVHTIGSNKIWKDVDSRLPKRYPSEYRYYCQSVGILPPDTVENHDRLYFRFMKSIVLQLRYFIKIKRVTSRFPTDDVTIRHSH